MVFLTAVLKSAHPRLRLARSRLLLQACKAQSWISTPILLRLAERSPCVYQIPNVPCRGIVLDGRRRNARDQSEKESGQVSISRSDRSLPGVSATQKVKQAGRDFTYLIVVLIGLGVTGGLLYVVFQELFSSSSPSKIYGKAFDKCKSHPEVIGAFGEPIKGYGETTRRGRRQHVGHVEYLKDGVKHMRLKFYIAGSEPGLQGTVHAESKENPETGKYEFRYIFVDIDTYPKRTIIVEDNR
ncbi:mitochondrial import inner membrane translocase subunit Tim21 [Denticeps clupeoides]|uniref:Mitochondrial import inner membrane translocase subunit Tim21 n=1 Tax=Denticeps clupeoides TaxID=299321 RepID=A0A8C4AWW2_9TELE|nr:mitochondrial import inner membrane translocase subunit Tim21-like [Denticeps clupeoides]XP_028825814.1 mitochondrial import inner membrane translocase subunit Tim21 [Denticeps clupeoides]